MSYTVEQIIQARCSGLYANANKAVYISLAEDSIDVNYFGAKYNQVVALKAMHLYTVDNNQNSLGGTGSIASKSEGDSSISFANIVNGNEDSFLQMSGYGKELLNLIKSTIPRISNTCENDNIVYPIICGNQ
jgi:hypothetical protein